jgi:hypothetical protein
VRTGIVILGVLLVLVGLVWVGQGLGYIKGSFMTGDMRWFGIGVGTSIAGAVIAAGAWRIRRGHSRA